MKKLFCIIGRSCSGKTSLSKLLAKELNLKIAKSYTTRPMRPGENEDDSDHYFINEDEAWLYRNQIIAKTKINGYSYFTTLNSLMNSDICVIDPNGYRILSNNLSKLHIKIKLIPIYIKVPEAELFERARHRGDCTTFYRLRYESEHEQFDVFEKSLIHTGFPVVHNVDFYRSIDRLKKIIFPYLSLKKKIQIIIKKLKKKGSR